MRGRALIWITAAGAALGAAGAAGAVSTAFDAGSGTYTITLAGAENAVVACGGGNVQIGGAVVGGAVACNIVKVLIVNGGASGNDVDLSAVPVGAPFTILETVTINGADGNDDLIGSERADTINGGAGSDRITGRGGDDALVGGTGSDVYLFASTASAQTDTITELSGEGTNDRVDLSALPAGVAGTVNLASDTELVKHEVRVVKTAAAGQALNVENATGGDGNDSLTGNAADNALDGGPGNDAINGADGADELSGGAGNDGLTGGLGSDVYEFATPIAAETDTLTELAETGDDELDFSGLGALEPVIIDLTTPTTTLGSHGIAPNTRTLALAAVGQAANFESVTGGPAGDTITGNEAANRLVGNGGNDLLSGRGGNDTLDGGAGSDQTDGSTGDDVYLFGPAAAAETDTIVERVSEGDDRVDFSTVGDAVTVNLASADANLASHTNRNVVVQSAGQAAYVEDAFGGTNNDVLTGNASSNELRGNAGQDAITGGDGNDILDGGRDNDTLIGGKGNDLYRLDTIGQPTEVDTVAENPAEGTDELEFDGLSFTQSLVVNLSAADQNLATIGQAKVITQAAGQALNFEDVEGGAGADTITGNAAANLLQGRDGNDVLVGLGGDDQLRGGVGSDRLEGRGGDDVYLFGPIPSVNVETDTIAEANGSGVDTLSFVDLDADDPVKAALDATDTALANHRLRTIVTAAARQARNIEEVIGGRGADELVGNSKANFLVGGQGNDTIRGAGGIDVLRGQSGDDLIDGGAGDDSIDGGSGNNRLLGAAGNDKLLAGIGTDTIEGGEGDDALYGGAGNDRLLGGLGRDLLHGGIGNDVLLARDGSRDTVVGGAGSDRAGVDRIDVRRGIETRI